MTQRAEIDRLINRLRELEDRVSDLEDGGRGEDAIGFGVEPDGEDFDEDDSEYRAVDVHGFRFYYDKMDNCIVAPRIFPEWPSSCLKA